MEQRLRLSLNFGSDIAMVVLRRISYAFRMFCAIYGFSPIIEQHNQQRDCDARLCYGTQGQGERDIPLQARYEPRPINLLAERPRSIRLEPAHRRLAVQSTECFWTGADGVSVDWLGEIFEWLSCADEYAVTDRDEVGRVPFGASVFGRFGLDPTIPYAGVAMRELNREIKAVVGDSWPERPSGPLGQSRVLIASSHDLDYLPISAIGNVRRILKNIAIALILYRDFSLATSVVGAVARGLVRGISPLDCVGGMLRGQTTSGIRSTYNIICRQAHPRDANYRLEDKAVTDVLSQIRAAGMEIGIHGSYTSLEAKGLGFEIEALARAGFVPSGVRQHWLRFSGDNLFEEIAACGLWYDSTVGFSDHAGFRAGACFPYLPYDFRREQAYPFLEIPLVLMDGAVYEQSRRSGASPQAICKRVFDMIECFGWGGVAILWHNAVFEGAQLPLDIGRLYWELKRSTHDWVSCREIVEATRSAFEGAFEMRYNDLEPHRKGLQACC